MDKPIHYEPHPVSAERKAELTAKGVRIIDAIYEPEVEKPKSKAKAKPEAAEVQ